MMAIFVFLASPFSNADYMHTSLCGRFLSSLPMIHISFMSLQVGFSVDFV